MCSVENTAAGVAFTLGLGTSIAGNAETGVFPSFNVNNNFIFDENNPLVRFSDVKFVFNDIDDKSSFGSEYCKAIVKADSLIEAINLVHNCYRFKLVRENRINDFTFILVDNIGSFESGYEFLVKASHILPCKESLEKICVIKNDDNGKVLEKEISTNKFDSTIVQLQAEAFVKAVKELNSAKTLEKGIGKELSLVNKIDSDKNLPARKFIIERKYGTLEKFRRVGNELSDKAAESIKVTSAANIKYSKILSEFRDTICANYGENPIVMSAFDNFYSKANAFQHSINQGNEKANKEAVLRMKEAYGYFDKALEDVHIGK